MGGAGIAIVVIGVGAAYAHTQGALLPALSGLAGDTRLPLFLGSLALYGVAGEILPTPAYTALTAILILGAYTVTKNR